MGTSRLLKPEAASLHVALLSLKGMPSSYSVIQKTPCCRMVRLFLLPPPSSVVSFVTRKG